jgi:glycerate dehydrogenase
MKVLAFDAYENDAGKALATYTGLDELLHTSDVITLHCPLFPETQGIICNENIQKMKQSVFIINASRGPLVVEQDLCDALNSGRVAGAAMDVVSTEPIKTDNPLLRAKNCLITPHIAWAPIESRQRLMDIAVDNLRAFSRGEMLNNVWGKEQND